jgi:hypothetical protein
MVLNFTTRELERRGQTRSYVILRETDISLAAIRQPFQRTEDATKGGTCGFAKALFE